MLVASARDLRGLRDGSGRFEPRERFGAHAGLER